ncbi:type VI secretion system tip protein VgrG [Limnobaculum zhutongyuii]|uniref:Type VI secretion system tip protein VgrG n=2 Tax=Limnobaculum zhutongyuii TaxID=2498113 RepID=A0A411WRB9_9GAMM|nr:type VI secretion system tip protein VgrG [Limnobaculum zhutongyuii]TQS87517.1 type VI secretion system tip protein VgrG [Limnobaculum zhutongyuii]
MANRSESFSLLNAGLSRYQLTIDGLAVPLSVLQVEGNEHLSQLWQYQIQFTADHSLSMSQVLSEKAIFTLSAINNTDPIGKLSESLASAFSVYDNVLSPLSGREKRTGLLNEENADKSRVLYGVITSFSQLAVSKDQTHYQITLSPRISLLAQTQGCAIYQNQTVPQIVESVLRQHDFTGVDFRFELTENYPVKEFVTQWQESDLAFIQRIVADSGIWFRFETHDKHSCDVVIFGDSEQQYQDGPTASYRQPSGNNDEGVASVWDMSVVRKTVPQSVLTQDYNYRDALADMQVEVNQAQKDKTTRGQVYLYGEHYRQKGEVISRGGGELAAYADANSDINQFPDDEQPVGQGAWYARIRHQRFITEQVMIQGKTTLFNLVPGQILTVNDVPISEALPGILIVAVQSTGNRAESYQIEFTAIPYDVQRPYRPAIMPWPTISGTLPARVTSPDNDTYSYIDIQGRYRVKMDFDLNDSWRKGEESLWLRQAKLYAGDTYGMHFPLIDGTEVAIAFTGGNPDRPYIGHAMHDSRHPDLVTIANHKRNVIRTPANNKLRMGDERGLEHIKLATEYGKTQLNLGHQVDASRNKRGEGFELRTDQWGAIRAGKGLLISADDRSQARSVQLDLDEARSQLYQAQDICQSLRAAAEQAQAELADLERQKTLLTETLDELKKSAILLSAPEGIAQTTPKSIQLAAGENIIASSGENTDFSVMKTFTLAAGERLSLFAQKLGIKLFAAKGKVEIRAQGDEMQLDALKDLSIFSHQGKVVIAAKQEIVLTCGGGYIRIANGEVEIGAPDRLIQRADVWQKFSGQSISQVLNQYGDAKFAVTPQVQWQQDGSPARNQRVLVRRDDGTEMEMTTDENGLLALQNSLFAENLSITIIKGKA